MLEVVYPLYSCELVHMYLSEKTTPVNIQHHKMMCEIINIVYNCNNC